MDGWNGRSSRTIDVAALEYNELGFAGDCRFPTFKEAKCDTRRLTDVLRGVVWN